VCVCVLKADSSDSDVESLTVTQERRDKRVLAVPAVRRIAMENKVFTSLTVICCDLLHLSVKCVDC